MKAKTKGDVKIQTMKKGPGVLAFQRGHVLSDALMFSLMINGDKKPVPVIRHGNRGTQNANDGKGNITQQKAATNGERDVSNLQRTESAKLDTDAVALMVEFHFSMLDMKDALHSCASYNRDLARNMRESVKDFIERAKKSEGLTQVALRYARNIANGRWLWRNRNFALSIKITVTKRDGKPFVEFNALDVPFVHFDNPSKEEELLAEEIANQMRGDSKEALTVTAVITPRPKGNIDVHPSENYAEKPRGFARALYKIGHPEPWIRGEVQDTRYMGHAAMRDQKIFNAIRTIDTWYPDFEDNKLPIPVEPLGANLSQQEFFRPGKYSSFEMFNRLVEIEPNSEEGMFCIAALDRGGVYSTSEKEDKKEKGNDAALEGALEEERGTDAEGQA